MTILSIIVVFISSIYSNFFESFRHLQASNLVYEEARFLMDRIVREVRSAAVDYEEYYHQNLLRQSLPDTYDTLRNDTYGTDYCQYSRQFYTLGNDGQAGTLDDQSTGQRAVADPLDDLSPSPPAIGFLNGLGESIAAPIQNDLFLISPDGRKRSYFKKMIRTDSLGNQVGQVGMLKLVGQDFGEDRLNAFDPRMDGSAPGINCAPDLGENDGRIDTWLCEDGFPCQQIAQSNAELCEGIIHSIIYDPADPEGSSFISISPQSLDIVDLKFIVSPMDDPRKGYNTDNIQIQPHVTIRMTVRAAPRLNQGFSSKYNPSLVIETTVSSRVHSEVSSRCAAR